MMAGPGKAREEERSREDERMDVAEQTELPRFSISGDGENKNSKLTHQFPAGVKEGYWCH